MTNYDVVKKLIGQINPIGETNADTDRIINLSNLVDLCNLLIDDISYVARQNKDHQEFSMKQAGKKAHNFLASHGIEY